MSRFCIGLAGVVVESATKVVFYFNEYGFTRRRIAHIQQDGTFMPVDDHEHNLIIDPIDLEIAKLWQDIFR